MASKTRITFTCDLCGIDKTHEDLPFGWILLSVEDSYCDRMFYSKHLCPSCVKAIFALHSKAIK